MWKKNGFVPWDETHKGETRWTYDGGFLGSPSNFIFFPDVTAAAGERISHRSLCQWQLIHMLALVGDELRQMSSKSWMKGQRPRISSGPLLPFWSTWFSLFSPCWSTWPPSLSGPLDGHSEIHKFNIQPCNIHTDDDVFKHFKSSSHILTFTPETLRYSIFTIFKWWQYNFMSI